MEDFSLDKILKEQTIRQSALKIDCKDFIKESKKILKNIMNAYYGSFTTKWLSEERAWCIVSDNHCDNCTQECNLEIDGEVRKVHASRKQGDCYYINFNKDEFVYEMEEIIKEDSIIHKLIQSDVI